MHLFSDDDDQTMLAANACIRRPTVYIGLQTITRVPKRGSLGLTEPQCHSTYHYSCN